MPAGRNTPLISSRVRHEGTPIPGKEGFTSSWFTECEINTQPRTSKLRSLTHRQATSPPIQRCSVCSRRVTVALARGGAGIPLG